MNLVREPIAVPSIGRLTLAVAFVVAITPAGHAEGITFRNDVMAVLSRAGCNQGACHGNQNGKNGFRLSLRGQDPEFDEASLTHDMLGRRADRLHPSESLLLLKATAAIPHEGGKRFGLDSPEYEILARWVRDGARPDAPGTPALTGLEVEPREAVLVAPVDHIRLRVRAKYSDGSQRDVSRLAVYDVSNPIAAISAEGETRRLLFGETVVQVRYLDRQLAVPLAFVPERKEFAWRDPPQANYVDQHVFAKLKTLRMLPSDLCSDSVFIRRAFLDVLGILPSGDEARSFLDDPRPDKRALLIDRLLERPEFADFWALKWSDILRNEEKTLDHKGVEVFHAWIRQSIADGKPLNEFARDIIAARGRTYTEPPANFYRAIRDPQARAEAVAQVFLGARLQCARCHNHPFDRWTQADYHALSAFFTRIQYRIVANNRRDKLDKHEFDGDQLVWMAREGEAKHPRTGEVLAPHFLGADTPTLAEDADRLQTLADWVAQPDNPFFARTQVNRIWYHLMGRGIVEPNDDFRASNPPSNPALLEALTRDFVAHRFDLRYLVRTILNSRTYQLSVVPNATNRDDEANFAHALSRPLQAEQLLDAIAKVTATAPKFTGFPRGLHASQLPGVRSYGRSQSESERFLQTFGKPDRLLTCECERNEDTTLGQAFQLITGDLINGALGEADNYLGRLLASNEGEAQVIDHLYLAALSRHPTKVEAARQQELVARSRNRRVALEDLAWALLNSKEFLLRP